MLQDYRRQIRIKPFAPILKDQTSKRWRSDISVATNISLLSISNSSKSNLSESENHVNQYINDRHSSSSRESISPSRLDESEEPKAKHVDLDPYILNKHINSIPSTVSNLVESDIDQSVNDLFPHSQSSNEWQNDDYNPRAIRPPPFLQYLKQIKQSQTKPKPARCRTTRIAVRTTKSEQLRLARHQSTTNNTSGQPVKSSTTKIPQRKSSFQAQKQQSIITLRNHISRSPTLSSNSSFIQSESIQPCRIALNSSAPLHLSSLLVKQMQEDIENNRVPLYSKPLNSALLREHPHTTLDHQYKIKRIYHWLEKLIPTNYIEYNEYASNQSTDGTNFSNRLEDDFDLLAEEKLPDNTERTYAEAHRVLPLFQSEVRRKTQQYNLLLTRLELDLYVT